MIKRLRRKWAEYRAARLMDACASLPHGEAKARALTKVNVAERKARSLQPAATRALIAAALCVGLLATTASTCTQPVIDTGKHCAKVAGAGTVNDILPKVNEVLGCSISDSSAIPSCVGSGLADLGVQFGIDFVLCALEQIESRKFVTPGDPDVGTRQRRAKAYLEARGEQAGLCPNGCGPSTTQLTWRWALPFEDMGIVIGVRAPGGNHDPCERGTRSYAWPPYAPDTVCVTTDPTVDADKGLAMVGETLAMLSKPSPFKVVRTVRPLGIGPGAGGG